MFHQTPNSGHPTTSIRTTHEVSRGVNNSCIFPTYPLFNPRLHTVALSMARLEDVSPGSSIVPAHVIVANRVVIRSIAPSLAMSPCAAALTRHHSSSHGGFFAFLRMLPLWNRACGLGPRVKHQERNVAFKVNLLNKN